MAIIFLISWQWQEKNPILTNENLRLYNEED